MTTSATYSEKSPSLDFSNEENQDQINSLIKPTLQQLKAILKSYLLFHLFFILLIVAELFYLFFHLTFLIQTFLVAINLALLFVTLFSYLTLILYFQTKKSERCIALKNRFVQAFKNYISYQEIEPLHSMTVSQACRQMANALHGSEYKIHSLSSLFPFLGHSLEKFSCWIYWRDVHMMQELLLQASIEEHLKLVRSQPTNLDVHAELANAYVMLSGLYVDPRTVDGLEEDHWIPPNKYNNDFQQKFRKIAEKAIEEFKILNDYAPDDPWIHTQLAYSYHDLQMPVEEMIEYETILRLCPDDQEILFKLGKLYFHQGLNAKGLQVYEQLKTSHYKKAEQLIHYYGAY